MRGTQESPLLLPVYRRFPLSFVYGKGARLYTSEGEEYLDFCAGIAVNSLGHNHPRLVEAICKQAERLLHVSNLFEIPEQNLLAERLRAWFDSDFSFFFCNSGAEANETALKIAKVYGNLRNKPIILVAHNSFHGRTAGALSLTAQKEFQTPFLPLLPDIVAIPFGEISALERALTDRVSAFFLEPVQAEGGGNFPPPGYLSRVRELTRKNETLLILDEVQTGIGRTGSPLYSMLEGVRPDIVTLAKGLGGGVSIGAVAVSPPFASLIPPGGHASTFGGNPLAMQAGLAVVEELSKPGVLEGVLKKGERILNALREWERAGLLARPRGAGLLIFFDVKNPRRLSEIALKEKVLIIPSKYQAVRITPPLLIGEEEIEEGLSRLYRALSLYAEEEIHAPTPA